MLSPIVYSVYISTRMPTFMHVCMCIRGYRLTSQLLLRRMCNGRVLPAFYFSRFINFDVSSLKSTRLMLSFCLNFNKKTVALANFLVTYLEVIYFMWSRADKLPSVVLCTMTCVVWILKGKNLIFCF